MTGRRAELGELETLFLLAVLRLEDGAHGSAIREEIAERGGRKLSRGATYATLNRLVRKGFLKPGPEPAEGASRRHFVVTDSGLATLRRSQRHLQQMRRGLESILDAV